MKKLFIRQRQFSKPSSAGNSNPKLPENNRTLPVEALDRVSVFETLRAYVGVVFQCREHLERLADSCRGIGRSLPVDLQTLQTWLKESLRNTGLKDALLRLGVHWFDPSTFAQGGEPMSNHERGHQGRLVLYLREFKCHPHRWYEKGVELKTATRRRWDFNAQDPQIKASQFMNGVLAILDTSGTKAHELVFFGPRGNVAEGTVSNLFIFKRKRLLTPAIASGILRGVTRSVVIGLANQRNIEVAETFLTRHEFYTAEECFMTNTSSEVLPVAAIDGRKIARGIPGPVTRLLAKDFKQLVSSGSPLHDSH